MSGLFEARLRESYWRLEHSSEYQMRGSLIYVVVLDDGRSRESDGSAKVVEQV